ncbi:MAG: glycine cleavage system aminomethyltransferase GcvT [Kiritimatiellia bacterium]
MTEDTNLKKTCLYDLHLELGARMSPFGGWWMPVQYSGIIREHEACRSRAALFDTDHMGEFLVKGEEALFDLENLVSCDITSMAEGQCRYGMMCNPEGGVVDDLLVYRRSPESFMLVVNASTCVNDLQWIRSHLSDGSCRIEDISAKTAKIDLQGPGSPEIIEQILESGVENLKFYHFMRNRYNGIDVLVSRTGYTGEMGFEIYLDPALAENFWKACMQLGAVPAGLGARDTLRLEMGMPLYGHELSPDRNAGESGLERSVSRNKNYIGADIVTDDSLRQSKLVGIQLQGRRAARHGDDILDVSGVKVGTVTSGSFAPSVGSAIALGYVNPACADPGNRLKLKSARCELDGEVVATPFYKNATARCRIKDFL